MVQSSPGIICKQTSVSTLVKQHLSESSGSNTPSDHKANPKASDLESFRQSLTSKEFLARAAELVACSRRPDTLFRYI